MDKKALQNYAVWAKQNLENQIEVSLKLLGIHSEKDIKPSKVMGDYTIIDGDGNMYPKDLNCMRERMITHIKLHGYNSVIEEFAYTWFNRLVALKFMELHDYLPHGFRVLSSKEKNQVEPEILKNLNFVASELGLDINECNRLASIDIEEVYRYVLFRQCKSLGGILPMLFADDDDFLELLLPRNLLKGETVITKLVEIEEENFLSDVEVIGWLYQFYISVKKDEVFKSKKTITKDTLPAVTQLFTPDWIVRYMAENSIGKLWLESYPESSIKPDMRYYIEDGNTERDDKYQNVKPEDIKILEPCCGSGHILVYAFDLLFKMYEEKGYQTRDIPSLILKNNLFGLDIDKRASQLASFALIMKARSKNNKFFSASSFVLPNVYDIWDSRTLINQNYKEHLKELKFVTDDEIDQIEYLVETFRYAKTIGSLLKVEANCFDKVRAAINKISVQSVSTIFNYEFLNSGISCLIRLVDQAEVLSAKYDVAITNPPYVSLSNMDSIMKNFATAYYPKSKSDLFSMFIEHDFEFICKKGFSAFMTPFVWMFIKSYEELRKIVINNKYINSLIQLEYSAFEEAIVPLCTFVLRNSSCDDDGVYIKLSDFKGGMLVQGQKVLDALQNESCDYLFEANQKDFDKIPGSPIAYWMSDKILKAFVIGRPLGEWALARNGMKTGDNERFIRLWHEISNEILLSNASDSIQAVNSNKRWFPYNKGGEFRKWYGNNDFVVNWENSGCRVIGNAKVDERNVQDYPDSMKFQPVVSWSLVSSGSPSFRYKTNCISDIAGMFYYVESNRIFYLLAFCNTPISLVILKMIAPTINFQAGNIASLPIINDEDKKSQIDVLVEQNIALSKTDWDSFETSWNFALSPFIEYKKKTTYKSNDKISFKLEDAYFWYKLRTETDFIQLRKNEEELNRLFIEIYGLNDELTADVADRDVTVARIYDTKEDIPASMKGNKYVLTRQDVIKDLISYLVGVAFGRYSLDIEGIAFAGGEFDFSQYITYKPDEDGVIPIYNQVGMDNGLTAVIIKLIKVIYGEDSYRENIDFIAESLIKRSNESSEETLNRYLSDEFYANHLKKYKKRPIYWQFCSGKNSGFKCLIYMHRYNSDTLAVINSKYFLPESTRLKNEYDEFTVRIIEADNKDKVILEKEKSKIFAAYAEALEYGQVLDHMANRYISIDLDDGVVVNYAKFQSVELVSDSGNKIKKDLLSPIK